MAGKSAPPFDKKKKSKDEPPAEPDGDEAKAPEAEAPPEPEPEAAPDAPPAPAPEAEAEESIEDQVARVGELSPEELDALEGRLVEQFDAADEASNLDEMNRIADLIDQVRAVIEAGGGEEPTSESEDVAPMAAAADSETEQEAEMSDAKSDADEVKETKAESTEQPKSEDETPKDEAEKAEPTTEEPGSEETPADSAAGEADSDTTSQPEASAEGTTTEEEAAVDVPKDREPVAVVEEPAYSTTLVAGADIREVGGIGSEFQDADQLSRAFEQQLNAIRRAAGDGVQHTVATIVASVPEERILEPGDVKGNAEKIAAVTGKAALVASGGEPNTEDPLQTLVASGGYCAPLETRYDIFGTGVTSRPVRDALAGFQAKRGGIRYTQPPKITDYSGAMGLWTPTADSSSVTAQIVTNKALTSNVATLTTSADHGYVVGQTVVIDINDTAFDGTFVIASVPTSTTFTYAKTNANVTSAAANGTSQLAKPSLKVACSPELTATADAVTLSLEFGNLMTRAYPELIDRHNQLSLVAAARFAENTLLNKISALSLATTTAQVLGAARDFLYALGKGAAAYRWRYRMEPTEPLRVIAPAWVRDMMREDMGMQIPGDDTFTGADAQIAAALRERNINVSWHLDGPGFAAEVASSTLDDFPATFDWFIYAEGSLLFLDGGTLDLGLIRDSQLVATNDYLMFTEAFEGVAKIGADVIKVTTTTKPLGKTSATVTTT